MSIYEYDAERHIAMEKAESREEGEKIGKEIEKIELVRKKIQKSKPIGVIADELECEPEDIRKIYEAILKCGIESSVDVIQEELDKE